MDNEMIERVARATYEKYDWGVANGIKDLMHNTVINAIKAMRKPTEKMLAAGAFIETAQSGVYSCEDVWQAMLDAIIND